jgi:hypothetical protein
MNNPNPYRNLPPSSFWADAVTQPRPGAIDPFLGNLRIGAAEKIATMGSCFAQHLSQYMARSGLTYFVPESAPPDLSEAEKRDRGFGVFSARYSNVYTARQALQLFQRAFGQFCPVDDVWERGDRFVDAFRPRIEPQGFASPEDVRAEAARHLTFVQRVFKESDWLIVTLGLTEAWRSRADGAVYPLAPGVAGGIYDPTRYEFMNASVSEVVNDLAALLEGIAGVNSALKVLLTVSPVAIIATYEPRHVLVSSVCTKSILRAAADEIERRFKNVTYFPGYEIVASPAADGRYYTDDLRQVNQLGLDHVTRVFAKHFMGQDAEGGVVGRGAPYNLPRNADIVCDEEEIERAFKKPKMWSK